METSTHLGSQYPGDAYSQRRRLEQELQSLAQVDPSFAPHAASAFQVVEELGRGGMGLVQRVRDRRLDREAALKLILPEASDEDGILRFRREAWVMAYLEHPAIPAIYESGRNAEGQLYILMQLLRGESLEVGIQELHRRRADMDDCRELLPYLLKASEAVAYAHDRGILHRDLKPSNMILGEYGELTVVDWGLAQALKPIPGAPSTLRQQLRKVPDLASLTQEGSVLGTPGYLAPEQARGEVLDERADVYALGAILTRILTGRPPVQGKSPIALVMATMNGEIETPRALRSDLPRELDFIAARALSFDREQRTPSAAVFAEQLRAYLLGRRVPGYPYSSRENLGRWARRKGMLIAWLLFLVAASAVGFAFWAVSLNLERRAIGIELKSKSETRRLAELEEARLLFSRARTRFGELDVERAVADLEAALLLNKGDAELGYDCARIAAKAGRLKRARSFLDRLPPEEKGAPRDLLYRYEIEMLAGGLAETPAARSMLRSLADAPTVDDPYQVIGRALIRPIEEAQTDAARATLRDASEKAELILTDLFASRRAGEAPERIDRLLLRAVSGVPASTDGLVLRARLFEAAGRQDFALSELNLAVLNAPEDAAPYLARASLLLKRGRPEAARNDIERARALGAPPEDLVQLEVFIAVLEGRVEDGEASLQASALSKSSSEFRLLKALIALKRSRWREAFDWLLLDKDRYSTSSLGYARLALTLAKLDRREEATRLVENAVRTRPSRSNLSILVSAALEFDRPDLGLRLLDRYAEDAPLDVELCLLQARCYNRYRRYSKEVEAYDRAVALDPLYFRTRLRRGMALLDLRRVREALEDFKVAVLVEPGSADAWRWRMFSHHQLGEHAEALQDWAVLKTLAGPKILAEYSEYARRAAQALKAKRR